MVNSGKMFFRWFLLACIILGFVCAYYFRLYDYLSLASLKTYRQTLISWALVHGFLAVMAYMLIYIAVVAFSIPGALFVTLAGGFLFGPVAACYVVVSATIGSVIVFLAVRTTLGEWLANKASGWVSKMKKGFEENAFNYLLVLRLMPFFPFWVVNIVSALLDVRLRDFAAATFIGIIPGVLIYVMVGNSLNVLFQTNQAPDLHIVFTPAIFLPLLGLAMLAMLPVIYKRWKAGKRNLL